jgi:hypothetical protein
VNGKEIWELLRAFIGIPSKEPRPNRYADVSRFTAIGGFIGLGIGFFLSGSILEVFLLGFAGGSVGGILALLLRRLGFSFSRVAVPNRRTEIARCIAAALGAALCLFDSVLNPNALFMFGTVGLAWYAVRRFQRQRALGKPSEGPE